MKYLSRFLMALSCAVLIALPAAAQQWSTPAAAFTAKSSTGVSSDINTAGATSVLFHVTGSSSDRTVTFYQGLTAADATFASVVVASPSAAGEAWVCPATPHSNFAIASGTAGTVTVLISWRSMAADPVGTGCHRINTFTGFSSATGTGVFSVSTGKTAAITQSLTLSGTDSTTMTFPTTNATLARTDAANTFTGVQTFSSPLAGTVKQTSAAIAGNGAIAVGGGVYAITKTGSALGSSTLATPAATTDDGKVMIFVTTTAYSHVISVASGKVNGGSFTTITFTTGAIGDSVTLVAYQGVWYAIATTGTITIT